MKSILSPVFGPEVFGGLSIAVCQWHLKFTYEVKDSEENIVPSSAKVTA